MSEQVPIDVRQVIAATCDAYTENAGEYATATADYAAYPGLRDEVLAFEKSLLPGLPVLDLGCGAGRDTRLLAGLGRRVVAADLCAAMLRRVRTHPAGGAVGRVRTDMLALPFADGVFGGVWACGSLVHLPSSVLGRALAEITRTLVPGGVAAISMRTGDREGWRDGGTLPGRRWFTLVDPDDFAAAMSAAGFDRVEVALTGREHWFVATGHR